MNPLDVSEQRYQTLVESSDDMIIQLDLEGTYLFVNSAGAKSMNCTPAGLIGKNVVDFVPATIAERIQSHLQTVATTKKSLRTEFPLHFNHSLRYLLATISPIKNELGEVSSVVAIIRDTTALHETELQLQLSKFTLDYTAQTVLWIDRDGTVLYLNFTALNTLQKVMAECLGRKIWELQKEMSESFWNENWETIKNDGWVRFNSEHVNVKNETHYVENHATYLNFNDHEYVILYEIDVTDQRLTEISLQEKESKYRSLFESMLNVFSYNRIICDEGGKPVDFEFIEVNPAFEKFVHKTQNEIVGKKLSEISAYQDEEWIRICGNVALNGGSTVMEYPSRSTGRTFRFSIYSPKKNYFCVISDDITEMKLTETTLKEAEQRWRNIADSTFEGILLSENDKIMDVNEQYAVMTGYTTEELIGMPLLDLVAPVDINLIKNAVITDTLEPIEHRSIRKDGTIFFAESRARTLSRGTKLLRMIAIRDITKQKESEAAFRESEEKWRTLLEYAPNAIFLISPSFEIQFVNRAFGTENTEDLFGKSFLELIRFESQELVKNSLTKVFANGDLLRFECQEKSGCYWLATMGPVHRDNQIVGVQAIITDVTEMKKIEKNLNISEQKFAHAFKSSPDSITIKRFSDGRYIEVNDGFTQLSGISREDAIGKTVQELNYGKVIATGNSDVDSGQLQTNRMHNVEVDFIRNDGQRFHTLQSSTVISINNEPCLLTITRDVSEKKQVENDLRLSEEKFAGAFKASPDSITISRWSDGSYIEVNNGFTRLFGYNRNEVVGKCIDEFSLLWVDPLLRDRFFAKMSSEGTVSSFEAEFFRKDGHRLIMSLSARTLMLNEEPCLLTIARDITIQKMFEQDLRQSEMKFASAFMASPDSITITKVADRTFIDVNDTFCKLSGINREFAIGKTMQEVGLSWESDAIETKIVESIRRDGFIQNVEAAYIVQGKPIHTLNSARKVVINDESCVLMISRDITERKKFEDELRLSEEKFSTAFMISPDAVVISRISDGTYYEVNEGFTNVMGYKRDEVINHTATSLNIWVDPNQRKQMVERLFEAGGVINMEVMLRTKTGAIISTLISGRAMMLHGELCVLTISRDVTDRLEAEHKLRQNEAQWRSLLEIVPNIIIRTDHNGLIEYVNHSSKNLMSHYALGSPIQSQIHPDYLDSFTKNVERVFQTGQVISDEAIGSDGISYFYMVGPYEINGSTDGLVVVLSDIAHLKKMELERKNLEEMLRQAQKMEAVGQLAGGVAHDFNNLLTPILGYSEMIMNDLSEEDNTYHYISEISTAAERAQNLTRQLLAFSRKQVLELKPVRLDQIIERFYKMMRRTIREDIEIKVQVKNDAVAILGDIGQIEQIVMNLSINAQDAMSQGGKLEFMIDNVVLDSDFCNRQKGLVPGLYSMFSVTDTGTGMSKEVIEKIFEPFFTTKEVGKGTGLGLATVFGIVKQHNGHISVNSTLGEGTTFQVYFPTIESVVEEKGKKRMFGKAEGGTERLLVVEDNENVRILTCQILESLGYEVISMDDPLACLRYIQENNPDVDMLLTDVVMPEMNGRKLYEEVSKWRADLKVLYMSGYSADIIAHQGVLEEGLHFLHKPFTIDQLASKVREVLKQ